MRSAKHTYQVGDSKSFGRKGEGVDLHRAATEAMMAGAALNTLLEHDVEEEDEKSAEPVHVKTPRQRSAASAPTGAHVCPLFRFIDHWLC